MSTRTRLIRSEVQSWGRHASRVAPERSMQSEPPRSGRPRGHRKSMDQNVYTKYEARHQSAQNERSKQTKQNTNHHQKEPFSDDHAENLLFSRAQSRANPEFMGAARCRLSHDAILPHACQNDRKKSDA